MSEIGAEQDTCTLAWFLSVCCAPRDLKFQERRSVSRAAHTAVIFIFRFSFLCYRRELQSTQVLGDSGPGPWSRQVGAICLSGAAGCHWPLSDLLSEAPPRAGEEAGGELTYTGCPLEVSCGCSSVGCIAKRPTGIYGGLGGPLGGEGEDAYGPFLCMGPSSGPDSHQAFDRCPTVGKWPCPLHEVSQVSAPAGSSRPFVGPLLFLTPVSEQLLES